MDVGLDQVGSGRRGEGFAQALGAGQPSRMLERRHRLGEPAEAELDQPQAPRRRARGSTRSRAVWRWPRARSWWRRQSPPGPGPPPPRRGAAGCAPARRAGRCPRRSHRLGAGGIGPDPVAQAELDVRERREGGRQHAERARLAAARHEVAQHRPGARAPWAAERMVRDAGRRPAHRRSGGAARGSAGARRPPMSRRPG